MTTDGAQPGRLAVVRARLRNWTQLLGRPGRFALVGLGFALSLLLVLGFIIPAAVERNLLDSRSAEFAHVAEDLVADGLLDDDTGMPTDLEEFDAAVRLHLIGIDVHRVILWDRSGKVEYSDAPELIGRTSPSEQILRALEGETVVAHPNPVEDDFEHVHEIDLVREYYVPIFDGQGEVLGVFEVYEDAASINSTIASTRLLVWISVAIGMGALLFFLLALSRRSLRVLDHRRRQAERLMAEMAHAQESERERVIGTLHDEIGQPLYRVLYGLEGSRSQLDPESPVTEELGHLTHLVRWIDGALRSELLMLHQGSVADSDLDTLLRNLVQDVRTETSLEIDLTINGHDSLSEGSRAAIFRATREAVTNSRKHAGASRIGITVTEGSHRVIVDVEDDGTGFAGEEGLGLKTTQDRLEAIGGGLKILTGSEGGTLFRAWVPIDGETSG